MDEYAERLVLDNMRLVYATCNRLTRAGVYSRMEREDMEQEGMIGLMQAAIAYDPARGVTFSTLAVTAIRNRILWVQQTANRQRRASNKNTLQLDKPIVEGKLVTLRDFLPDKTVDVEVARQFAIRCWMTFGARTNRKTGWRNTTGKTRNSGPDNPAMWRRLPDVIVQVADRLRDAQIENRPALEVIQHNDGAESLIYADPPYIKSTRTLNGDQYRFEMTDAEHEALLHTLLVHRGMVLLSGYDCELYRDTLRGWRMEQMNTTAERGAPRTECLWMNPACMERQQQMMI